MPDKLRIIIDTREQTPLVFDQELVVAEAGTLNHGDYSVFGLTDMVVVERKSLPDLVACVGRERDRFERELVALRGYHCRAVVIEATLKQIEAGNWRGQVLPQHVLGSIASWRVKYQIDFVYSGSAESAAGEVYRLLHKYHDYLDSFSKRLKNAMAT